MIDVKKMINNIKVDEANSFIDLYEDIDLTNDKIVAIKDIHSYKNKVITFGSEVLANQIAIYDSTVVKNLKEKGYNIIGTTNLDEFAMGSTNMTSHFGPVNNIIGPEFSSGGSSGGSAYAVAKGLVPVATGTDTGGSVRQPAALNGIYGFKPTYGLISRYGTFSFASSFDTIGSFGRNIDDTVELLQAMISNDESDQTNFVPKDYDIKIDDTKKLNSLKVGVFYSWINEKGVDPEIKDAFLEQINSLKENDVEIIDMDVSLSTYSFELYVALAFAEASSNLNRYDGIRFGFQNEGSDLYCSNRDAFGSEVKKRIIMGTYMLNSEHSKEFYTHAQKIRMQMKKQFDDCFSKVDVILGPTTPKLAFKKGTKMHSRDSYLSDKFTIPANLCGIPALNIPIKTAKDGRHIGMQVMADRFAEHKIYLFAKRLEELNV